MTKPRQRRTRHPWDEWFSSSGFLLVRDRDYWCMPHSMGVQVRQAAERRGLNVSVQIDPEGTISVQVLD